MFHKINVRHFVMIAVVLSLSFAFAVQPAQAKEIVTPDMGYTCGLPVPIWTIHESYTVISATPKVDPPRRYMPAINIVQGLYLLAYPTLIYYRNAVILFPLRGLW